eukprot:m.723506 g.723506  ORF g.723506 m.723506 type:complete len:307 (-) comp23022_c0_seq10:2081-3001(-)
MPSKKRASKKNGSKKLDVAFQGYITQPVRYLGKLFVDRVAGEKPGPNLLYKALTIIRDQAPEIKPEVAFFTTEAFENDGRIRPAALVGRRRNGDLDIIQPIIAMSSIGHSKEIFVYVTMERLDKKNFRFWVHAFLCRKEKDAATLSATMIKRCTQVRKEFEAMKDQHNRMRLGRMPSSGIPAELMDESRFDQSVFNADDADADTTLDMVANIDLTSALSRAAEIVGDGGPPNRMTHMANMDTDLTTAAMDEMYDLNVTLMKYQVTPELRQQLLDAWQQGYSTGGELTQMCKGVPQNLTIATKAMVV